LPVADGVTSDVFVSDMMIVWVMYATASVKLPTAALALDRYFNAYGNFVLIVQAALRSTA
jgi:hypothetical protein